MGNRSDLSVEAVEHGFDWDKSAIYVIERSVWRFAEPGGIVADAGRAVLGYARVFDAGVDEWMNERTKERMVVLALLTSKYKTLPTEVEIRRQSSQIVPATTGL